MPRKPMQDIVPKSIRNIPVPETRQRVPARKEPIKEPVREPVRESLREPIQDTRSVRKERIDRLQKIEKIEAGDEPVNLHYERETPLVPPIQKLAQKEVLDKVRRQFESARVETPEPETSVEYEAEKEPRSMKKIWISVAAVAVVGLAVLASTLFHGATLAVTPRTVSAAIQSEYTAKKSAVEGALAFESVTIKQTGSESVKATGEKQVEKKASGTIVIYNNYSSASQRLIKNTRFATPEGLIFRITDSVNVPGKSGTTPGQVEAVVTADEAGEKYNVGVKDFTIPGFKGDPRYAGFYARSKTAIAGGFSGMQKVVADADRAKAKTNIETKLTKELLLQAAGQVPDGSVFLDKAYKLDFTALPDESSGSDVIMKIEGVLSMVIFDKNTLSKEIAAMHIKDYKGDPILVTDLDKITFAPKGEFKPATSDSIAFFLSGNATFEWLYDELALKQALAGKTRAEIPETLQKYPMIEKADISIRPFWLRKFPKSLDKITIEKEI